MINELHINHKRPLSCLQNTRIGGDAIFGGNGMDAYDVKIEWEDAEDKRTPGNFRVLEHAKITLQLIKE